MPKPSFLQRVRGRPSRSYADTVATVDIYGEGPVGSRVSSTGSLKGYNGSNAHDLYGYDKSGSSRRTARSALSYGPRDDDGSDVGFTRSEVGVGSRGKRISRSASHGDGLHGYRPVEPVPPLPIQPKVKKRVTMVSESSPSPPSSLSSVAKRPSLRGSVPYEAYKSPSLTPESLISNATSSASEPQFTPPVIEVESDDDAFYTPRSSFESRYSQETPQASSNDLPVLQLQPPTPMADSTTPPLERSEALLSPGYVERVPEPIVEEPAPTPRTRKVSVSSNTSSAPPVPPKSPSRAKVRNAEMSIVERPSLSRSTSTKSKSSARRPKSRGSDDWTSNPYKTSEVSSSRPTSRPSSRPTSVIGSEMDELRPGYGKGGWAAARAAPVVMYMPSGGDGWAAFQPLPPRSRFSVMPPSQVSSASFDEPRRGSGSTWSGGSSSLAPSASASQDGRYGMHSPPTRSPANAAFRKYEPTGLSQSSSPVSSPRVSPEASPGVQPDDDSDDDSVGEAPSRSYAKTMSPPPSQMQSDVDFDRASEETAGLQYDDSKERRWAAGYHPYADGDVKAPSTTSATSSYAPSLYAPSSLPPTRSNSGEVPRLPYIPMQVPTDPALATVLRSSRPGSIMSEALARGLERPSTLDPDLLTFLPEMSADASNRLYTGSEAGRRTSSDGHKRSLSIRSFYSRSDVGSKARSDVGAARPIPPPSERGSVRSVTTRFSTTSMGTTGIEAQLMESHGRDEAPRGYTNLVLPQGGGFKPASRPSKDLNKLNPRITGLPHSSMAAITLCRSAASQSKDESPTPLHLRHNLPPLVEFTSHVQPPSKVHDSQIMVQVYAVAVDYLDVAVLDDKTNADVRKYIPGRSFVGRCLAVGSHEKEIVRGDLVIGLVDIKKSGALCEYMLVERRRVARAPSDTRLSLEQLAVLPSQGIAAVRALRGNTARGARAVVMDAHEGIAALMCQEMSRLGVAVTAIIPGGEGNEAAHAHSLANGARGVLTGSPAAVLLSLEEDQLHIIVDTRGGTKILTAAQHALVDGGRVISLADEEVGSPTTIRRSRSIKSFKSALGPRRRINIDYIHPAGTGEPEVDSSGLDCRDVLEEMGMVGALRPRVDAVVPFERGPEAFAKPYRLGINVVRIIN